MSFLAHLLGAALIAVALAITCLLAVKSFARPERLGLIGIGIAALGLLLLAI